MTTYHYDLVLDKLNHPKLKPIKRIDSVTIDGTDSAAQFILEEIFTENYAEELVFVIGLSANNSILGVFKVGMGLIDSCTFSTAGIFKRLLLVGASSFLVVHNHPSGSITPSNEDVVFTTNIRELGSKLGIRLLDSFIYSNGRVSRIGG